MTGFIIEIFRLAPMQAFALDSHSASIRTCMVDNCHMMHWKSLMQITDYILLGSACTST